MGERRAAGLAVPVHRDEQLAGIEQLGGTAALPVPNSFPHSQEKSEFAYAFFVHSADGTAPQGRWTEGPSLDGKGQFEALISKPLGQMPQLAPAPRMAARRWSRRQQIRWLEPRKESSEPIAHDRRGDTAPPGSGTRPGPSIA
jgi:Mn-containing catalase